MKDFTPIAVTSRSFSNNPVLRKALLENYGTVTFNTTGKVLSGESLVDFLKGHVKTIVGLELLDEHLFSQLHELQVVSKYGVGLDNIDLQAMRDFNVRLGWTPGVNKRSVAELVLCFAISLLRDIPAASRELREGLWRPQHGRELSGKIVGVIGCGSVGKDVISLLRPFECTTLVHDILDFHDFYDENHATPVSLEELMTQSDIITIHVPLDNSTRNLLSADRLALLKRSAILINTSRGEVIDAVAIKAMLIDRRLAGVACDVFSPEPPEDMELIRLPNFFGTPHIGGSTEEAILAMGYAAISGLDSARIP